MTPPSLDQRFAHAMGQLLGPEFPSEIGLAVSGGGDSMAMLALAHNWARVWGVRLQIFSVDHGLRAQSADEAAMVARECATLGHQHRTLVWQYDGKGNVQDAARRARIELIGNALGDIRHVLMAHTRDDVAETFLMRLARGSGVDGLSSMQEKRELATFTICRPCLGMTRAELRHFLKVLNVPFVDDPTNDDPKYGRARARAMLPVLRDLGLDANDLVQTAERMRRASHALRARAVWAGEQMITEAAGALHIARDEFSALERDTQLRLLAAACMWIGGAQYRPRSDALEDLLDKLMAGGAGTLGGMQAATDGAGICLWRELNALDVCDGPIWDGRWRIDGDLPETFEVRALGDAISQVPDWRDTGVSRAVLMATPSIWVNNSLISAPIAGLNPAIRANIVVSFATYLNSH